MCRELKFTLLCAGRHRLHLNNSEKGIFNTWLLSCLPENALRLPALGQLSNSTEGIGAQRLDNVVLWNKPSIVCKA